MEKPYFCPRYKDKEMKTLVACLILALLLSGCKGKDRPVAEPDEPQSRADTLAAVDAAVNDADEPSDAVDRLFDDFIYTFMRDRTFQLKRISFPLSNRVDGVDRPIERKQWKFDPLYAHSDFYTMIFDSERAVSREKDPKLDHVEVEWIYLNRGRVKQYIFKKQSGKWMLVGLNAQDLSQNANSDFYKFYHRFASDSDFQLAHIENPFEFRTFDSDNFQEIDGLLDVAQWPDYCPTLPSDVMTNINYGQHYRDSKDRVLVLTSPSAGMSCTLVFQKKQGIWKLVGFENI